MTTTNDDEQIYIYRCPRCRSLACKADPNRLAMRCEDCNALDTPHRFLTEADDSLFDLDGRRSPVIATPTKNILLRARRVARAYARSMRVPDQFEVRFDSSATLHASFWDEQRNESIGWVTLGELSFDTVRFIHDQMLLRSDTEVDLSPLAEDIVVGRFTQVTRTLFVSSDVELSQVAVEGELVHLPPWSMLSKALNRKSCERRFVFRAVAAVYGAVVRWSLLGELPL